ncbi:UNVERIFIED_CONTAM: hypothetical protein FKN15_043556 [Acipenser sinensis]
MAERRRLRREQVLEMLHTLPEDESDVGDLSDNDSNHSWVLETSSPESESASRSSTNRVHQVQRSRSWTWQRFHFRAITCGARGGFAVCRSSFSSASFCPTSTTDNDNNCIGFWKQHSGDRERRDCLEHYKSRS